MNVSMHGVIFAVAILTCRWPSVLAQESSTELVHHGLSFSGAPAASLQIESEQIVISPETIQIKYQVSNGTAQPVATILTLPLPDLDFSDPDTNWSIPAKDPINFIGLNALVRQKPAALSFNQEAFLNGKNVSAVLRQNRLALIPVGTFHDELAALPPSVREQLAAAGLLTRSGTDPAGNPLYFPSWSVKSQAKVKISFAPSESVAVELRSQTSLGFSPDSVLREPLRSTKELASEVAGRQADYCTDKSFYGGVDKIITSFLAQKGKSPLESPAGPAAQGQDPGRSRETKGLDPPPNELHHDENLDPQPQISKGFPPANVANIREWRIAYDLAAGASSAPVKDFRLLVDKSRTDRIVSFCLDGLKKVSPTAFEMRAADFSPSGLLRILLIGRE